MNKLILLVFCHLVGDYVLQNDFIAKTTVIVNPYLRQYQVQSF